MATIQETERKKGTVWRVVWRDTDTKKVRSRVFDTEDKAKTFKEFLDSNANSFKVAAEAKRVYDKRIPRVHEIVERHISMLSKVQPGTIKKYRSRAKLHINDSKLGNMVIDRVTKEHIMEWMDGLRSGKGANVAVGSELSSRSKGELHALLSSAFNTAVEEGVMVKNVAKGVGDAEANDGREPVYLSKEDLQLIEDAMPERYRLFIRLLSKTGLRYSEATALRKRDIRVQGKRCTVNVNRAWKATEAGEEIGVPKSKKARRNVSCGLALSADLIEHMKTLEPGDLLFTRTDGEYLRNSYFHKVAWQPAINKLVADGALDFKPWIHEIRKAHTTHLLQAGTPVHVVQARLGHERPQTTLNIYAQVVNDDDQNAADALD